MSSLSPALWGTSVEKFQKHRPKSGYYFALLAQSALYLDIFQRLI